MARRFCMTTLVLVPTAMELAHIVELGGFPREKTSVAVCGFGVVAAAARAAQSISDLRPQRVLLLGIAGALDPEFAPIGSALEFSSVAIDGIGVGEGDQFLTPQRLGFPQWQSAVEDDGRPIFDRLDLAAPPSMNALLLTVCAASADRAQTASRRNRMPEARAEDMEGFAVAMACTLQKCPLRIVRGISNLAGDRERSGWRVPAALAAARDVALGIINGEDRWGTDA